MTTAITASNSGVPTDRLEFFNLLRNMTMLFVIIYHAVASYGSVVDYWPVHDTSTSILFDLARHIIDVFIMPIFFFIAGYFALKSIEKKNSWLFIKSKVKRLGVYWFYIVLIPLPFFWWKSLDPLNQVSRYSGDYFTYWLDDLSKAGKTTIGPLSDMPESFGGHMHFWFISLLFLFFVVFALLYSAWKKWPTLSKNLSRFPYLLNHSLKAELLIFGFIIALGCFVLMLVFPDFSWVIIQLVIQFQPTKLVMFIGYFGLGVHTSSRNWFTAGKGTGRLIIWIPACGLLTVVFLLAGGNVFTNPASQKLPPILLLVFALGRSYLGLSVLVVFVTIAMRYSNRARIFNQKAAGNNYNIYLVHFFVVIVIQLLLVGVSLTGIVLLDLLVKVTAVLGATVIISYIISEHVIKNYPRGTAIAIAVPTFVMMIIFPNS